jgi:hypothetical protein
MADKKNNKNNKKSANEAKDDLKSASKEEQAGFHKGALSTLAKERQELARILQIVEQLMQLHLAALKDLGVDLEKEAQEAMQPQQVKKPGKPIEDML